MKQEFSRKCNKLFHQFKLKGRTIILCIKGKEPSSRYETTNYYIGMSTCNPEDKFDEKLGKQIAEGRARRILDNAGNTKKTPYIEKIDLNYMLTKYGILKTLLKIQEEEIKKNPEKYIKSLK